MERLRIAITNESKDGYFGRPYFEDQKYVWVENLEQLIYELKDCMYGYFGAEDYGFMDIYTDVDINWCGGDKIAHATVLDQHLVVEYDGEVVYDWFKMNKPLRIHSGGRKCAGRRKAAREENAKKAVKKFVYSLLGYCEMDHETLEAVSHIDLVELHLDYYKDCGIDVADFVIDHFFSFLQENGKRNWDIFEKECTVEDTGYIYNGKLYVTSKYGNPELVDWNVDNKFRICK